MAATTVVDLISQRLLVPVREVVEVLVNLAQEEVLEAAADLAVEVRVVDQGEAVR